ncbi:MAG: hypothetical protein HOP02_00840 [Methylococcaceae bacterium]|nr:hypothetical protein [Methylococcaceae bacterium]
MNLSNMKLKILCNAFMRFILRWLLRLTALVVLSVLLVKLLPYEQYRNYQENERTDNFNHHYEVFKKLEAMQREDINIYYISLHSWIAMAPGFRPGIDDPTLWPTTQKLNKNLVKITLSKERWNEYKLLLKQANVELIAYDWTRQKRNVTLCNMGDCEESYDYTEEGMPPQEIFNSYSECRKSIKSIPSDAKCYLPLRGNWYQRIR